MTEAELYPSDARTKRIADAMLCRCFTKEDRIDLVLIGKNIDIFGDDPGRRECETEVEEDLRQGQRILVYSLRTALDLLEKAIVPASPPR